MNLDTNTLVCLIISFGLGILLGRMSIKQEKNPALKKVLKNFIN